MIREKERPLVRIEVAVELHSAVVRREALLRSLEWKDYAILEISYATRTNGCRVPAYRIAFGETHVMRKIAMRVMQRNSRPFTRKLANRAARESDFKRRREEWRGGGGRNKRNAR